MKKTRPIPARPISAAAALALVLGVSGVAMAQDSDGDGVPDAVDAYPCDPEASAVAFAPARGDHGLLMYEDLWPSRGDLDFNDVVVTYNYIYRMNGAGRVLSLRATYNLRALGGLYTHGLGLRLPVARGAVQSVTRVVGSGSPEVLAPSTGDDDLTVVISHNLRELFGNAAGPINSEPGSALEGSVVEVLITFASPVILSSASAPNDVFIFRSATPSHEIHRPEFGGTSAMDMTLFGTADDGSTGARRFVDFAGLPFGLHLPTLALYPREGVSLSTLYPGVVLFAASGGTEAADFYTQNVNTAAAFGGAPAPRFRSADTDADRSCVVPAQSSGDAGLSCLDVLQRGGTATGVYWIDPDGAGGQPAYEVWCDQTTDGGGWTVFQRRFDGSVGFYRYWTDYRVGFGSAGGEHWLGNERISRFTALRPSALRIDLRYGSSSAHAAYSTFSLSNEADNYRLSIGSYSGTAGDALSYHAGRVFSTRDRNGTSCAQAYLGAWWYGSCHHSNLNGTWGLTTYAQGPVWNHWLGYYVPMSFTEMKMRER